MDNYKDKGFLLTLNPKKMPTKVCSFLPKLVICERIYEVRLTHIQRIIIAANAAQMRKNVKISKEGYSYTPSIRYKQMYEKLKRKI